MSENINLISVTDLPVAEGDNVNVLCTENGELKQKPANGLGGASDYDLVLRVSAVEDVKTVEVESGSDVNVVEKIRNGEEPKIKILSYYTGGDNSTGYESNSIIDACAIVEKDLQSEEEFLIIANFMLNFAVGTFVGTNTFEFIQ